MLKILLDPGHGLPFDGGASANDVVEAELVLDVALALRERLLHKVAGVTVTMTRETNRLTKRLSLEARGAIGIGAGVDLVVSLHANAMGKLVEVTDEDGKKSMVEVDDPAPKGLLTFHRRDDAIAQAMCAALEESEPFALSKKNAPIEVNDTTWKRAKNVLRQHQAPAILVELGFVTNRGDANALQDADVREQLVHALVAGILAGAAMLYMPVPKPVR